MKIEEVVLVLIGISVLSRSMEKAKTYKNKKTKTRAR